MTALGLKWQSRIFLVQRSFGPVSTMSVPRRRIGQGMMPLPNL